MRSFRDLLAALAVGAAVATAAGVEPEVLTRAVPGSSTEAAPGAERQPRIIAHLVPHTHDDPGWLKTWSEYYEGSQQWFNPGGVRFIYHSVILALEEEPARRFVIVEMSFFMRWWFEQTEVMHERVRRLVHSTKQLEFANGGFVMHDEASASYQSMIDQTTFGHDFLATHLGYTPTVTWQIDPFGHSATSAALSADMGFSSLFFGRMDYQDRALRMARHEMEFVWRGSASLGRSSDLFTAGSQSGNYGPPSSFCLDVLCEDEQIIEHGEDRNVEERTEDFIQAILELARHQDGANVFVYMGSDFCYMSAPHWYLNMESMMRQAEGDPRIELRYSTPSEYIAARHAEALTWTVTKSDFFPYADAAHAYWTGYFSSRPTFKYLERISSSYLQALRYLTTTVAALLPASSSLDAPIAADDALTAMVGLANHHDAITGTEKQHVADDYTKLLSSALARAEDSAGQLLAATALPGVSPAPDLVQCRLMANGSSCAFSEALEDAAAVVVVYNPLPRTRVSAPVRVPLSVPQAAVADDAGAAVEAQVVPGRPFPGGAAAPYELVFEARSIPALSSRRYIVTAGAAAVAEAGVPAAAVTACADAGWADGEAGHDYLEVAHGEHTLTFDRATGQLVSLGRSGVTAEGSPLALSVGLAFYRGFGSPGIELSDQMAAEAAEDRKAEAKLRPQDLKHSRDSFGITRQSSQASGAYIFRTAEELETPTPAGVRPTIEVVRGDVVTEVRQSFAPWANQTLRLSRGSPYVEVEWTVGPVPVDDGVGREVVLTLSSELATEKVLYTDANGREFQQRVRNERPTWDLVVSEPVAGNFYPVTAAAWMADEAADLQLSVLTDRSQSMGSVRDGDLDVLVHRRLLVDDGRGVGEPLNETVHATYPQDTPRTIVRHGDGIVVRGSVRLHLGHAGDARPVRRGMDELLHPPVVAFGGADAAAALVQGAAGDPLPGPLARELPVQVQLVTLRVWPETPGAGAAATGKPEAPAVGKRVLLRLGHAFALGEDAELSRPVDVDVAALLTPLGTARRCTRMSLSANQDWSRMKAKKLRWRTLEGAEDVDAGGWDGGGEAEAVVGCSVRLHAMAIVTVEVEFE